MPKTGAHLRIESLGTNVLGVKLEGNHKKPEPESLVKIYLKGPLCRLCDRILGWILLDILRRCSQIGWD